MRNDGREETVDEQRGTRGDERADAERSARITPVRDRDTVRAPEARETDVALPLLVRGRGDGRPVEISDRDVVEYRRRIIAGYYRSPAVIDAIARRILLSGDV